MGGKARRKDAKIRARFPGNSSGRHFLSQSSPHTLPRLTLSSLSMLLRLPITVVLLPLLVLCASKEDKWKSDEKIICSIFRKYMQLMRESNQFHSIVNVQTSEEIVDIYISTPIYSELGRIVITFRQSIIIWR